MLMSMCRLSFSAGPQFPQSWWAIGRALHVELPSQVPKVPTPKIDLNLKLPIGIYIYKYNPPWLKPYGLEQPMCRIKWKTQGHFIKTTFWENEQHTFKIWYSVRPSRWLNSSYKAAFPLGFIRPKIRVYTIIVNVRFSSFIFICGLECGYHNMLPWYKSWKVEWRTAKLWSVLMCPGYSQSLPFYKTVMISIHGSNMSLPLWAILFKCDDMS